MGEWIYDFCFSCVEAASSMREHTWEQRSEHASLPKMKPKPLDLSLVGDWLSSNSCPFLLIVLFQLFKHCASLLYCSCGYQFGLVALSTYIFISHIYGNSFQTLFTHVAGITIATYLSAMTELLAVSPVSYGANIQIFMLITMPQLSGHSGKNKISLDRISVHKLKVGFIQYLPSSTSAIQ